MGNPQKYAPATKPLRVLISATSPLTRAGLEGLLETQLNLKLIGAVEYGDLESAIAESYPDVVVVSVETQPRTMRWQDLSELGVPIVLCAANPEPSTAAAALCAGVQAIVGSDGSASELNAAVTAAAHGLLVVSGELKDVVRQGLLVRVQENEERNRAPMEGSSPEHLTTRELEVLEMIVEGLSNKEIAAQLDISAHTVKFHTSSILGKLGASSRTEAASIGLRRGLITI